MKRIEAEQIRENAAALISGWMLVTAGSREKFNTMTASWGGMGFLWGKPVVFVFVRPERYTYEFMERETGFTLSFFPDGYRKALSLCGSRSGRDTDKVRETGLMPFFTEAGNPAFAEARLVLECRKLYAQDLTESSFTDPVLPGRWYGANGGGLHRMYVAEIVHAWEK